MKLHIEKEYKILVSKDQFERLLQHYPQAVFQKQVNTYYDTENLLIRKKYGAMRIREIGSTFIFTLKERCDHGVKEHECIVTENSLKALQTEEIQGLLQALQIHQPIVKIAQLTTYRAVIPLENAELCFDYSEYNDTCDYEIEYEYTKPHDGLQAFNQILSSISLTYKNNCPAKIKRAIQTRKQDD